MPVVGGQPRVLQKWWVIQRPSGSRAGVPLTQAVSGLNKPTGTIAGPFPNIGAAQAWIKDQLNKGINIPNPIKAVQGFFGGLGGMIGGGIESGFITSLQDIWDVIVGPAEVILGFLVAAFVLVVYFKDDIVGAAGLAAKALAVAA